MVTTEAMNVFARRRIGIFATLGIIFSLLLLTIPTANATASPTVTWSICRAVADYKPCENTPGLILTEGDKVTFELKVNIPDDFDEFPYTLTYPLNTTNFGFEDKTDDFTINISVGQSLVVGTYTVADGNLTVTLNSDFMKYENRWATVRGTGTAQASTGEEGVEIIEGSSTTIVVKPKDPETPVDPGVKPGKPTTPGTFEPAGPKNPIKHGAQVDELLTNWSILDINHQHAMAIAGGQTPETKKDLYLLDPIDSRLTPPTELLKVRIKISIPLDPSQAGAPGASKQEYELGVKDVATTFPRTSPTALEDTKTCTETLADFKASKTQGWAICKYEENSTIAIPDLEYQSDYALIAYFGDLPTTTGTGITYNDVDWVAPYISGSTAGEFLDIAAAGNDKTDPIITEAQRDLLKDQFGVGADGLATKGIPGTFALYYNAEVTANLPNNAVITNTAIIRSGGTTDSGTSLVKEVKFNRYTGSAGGDLRALTEDCSVVWSKTDFAGNILAGSEWTVKPKELIQGEEQDTIEGITDNTGSGNYTGADEDPAAGKFKLTGLLADTYVLVETKAPVGYLLDSTEYEFTVSVGCTADTPIEIGAIKNRLFTDDLDPDPSPSASTPATTQTTSSTPSSTPTKGLAKTGSTAGILWIIAGTLGLTGVGLTVGKRVRK